MLSGVVTVAVATRGDVGLDVVDVVVRIATIEVAACEALRKSSRTSMLEAIQSENRGPGTPHVLPELGAHRE